MERAWRFLHHTLGTNGLEIASMTNLELGPRFAEVWVGYLNIREYHRPIFTGWLNQQLLGVTKNEFKYQMFRPLYPMS